jgi:hypothetical protein
MAFIQLNPRTIPTESNDCVVRALTIALNKSYDEVHAICGASGRRPNKGMTVYEIEQATKLRFDLIPRNKRVSFAQFAEQNPTGRYVVIKRGHAVALIDGVWYDAHRSACGPRSKVMTYCKID